jgi:dUTP pyrophosphatase
MNLKIKLLATNAVLPSRAHATDAGLDLTATSYNWTKDYIEYGTGLAVAIPPGHVGLIFPRSSLTTKDLVLGNSVGVIDETYRGEIMFRFKEHTKHTASKIYNVGDRIGQLVIVELPKFSVEQVDDLDATERGTGGFGSSGQSGKPTINVKK